MNATSLAPAPAHHDQRSFLLQRAQPAMTGLIDGSLSTLAPIFAVALATHRPHYAFLAGLATAIGTGVSMLVALATIALELLTLAWIRWRFFSTSFVRSVISIALGGAIIATVSAALGAVG
jgi:hypothetical protein